jgi:Na+/melibiose symporter-like transporter
MCVLIALALTPAHRRFDDPAGRGERLPLARLSAPLRFVLALTPLRLLALSGLYGALQNCLTTFLVVFLAEGLGYPLIQAGMALTASQLAGMVGRIGWGALAGRLGSGTRLLGVLGLGMGASAITTLLLAPGWPLGLVLLLAAGLGATASG